ncbi:MAG: hypothetical protein IPM54_36375 [Polyangiaceae bacterium]|nr:hypothetical protein [Polyangiaceae bacterium]
MKRLVTLAFVLSLAACAPIPRPPVFAEVEAVRDNPANAAPRELAPTAYAHADKLRAEAQAAFDAGDVAGSQILAERSLAAYAHALVQARIARAEAEAKDADAALAASQTEIATLDTEQARVAAEVTALEARIRVSRDAQPITPSGNGSPEREVARVAAARSLALEAKMLCTGARLLLPSIPEGSPPPVGAPERSALALQLDEAELVVTKTHESLAAGGRAPIDLATRARAGCLSVLTNMRRSMTPAARAPGKGDALLGEISATRQFSPFRDERGVVVTLRDVFSLDKLTPAATQRIEALGRIAKAHPGFPLAAVVHVEKEPTAKDDAASKARADALAAAFRSAGIASINVVQAGAAAPVVDPAGSDRKRNARVEIVFITPETF